MRNRREVSDPEVAGGCGRELQLGLKYLLLNDDDDGDGRGVGWDIDLLLPGTVNIQRGGEGHRIISGP